MFRYSFKLFPYTHRVLAGMLIAALIIGALPFTALAVESASSTDLSTGTPTELQETTGGESNTSTSTPATSSDTASSSVATGSGSPDAATSTPQSSDGNATSTEQSGLNDGVDGESATSTPDAFDGESATTTATSTPDASGDTGESGADGEGGAGGLPDDTATTTTEGHESEPIPFVSDGLIGDTDAPEGEEVTGKVREHARNNIAINTGQATAQGEVETDANATNLRSIADAQTLQDLDFYRFDASGSNDAVVTNDVAAVAVTGENRAIAGGRADVTTGDAVSVFNIANVVNSNIINSDGYLYLANQILDENTSLNLQDFFFPSGGSALAAAAECNLNSCLSEDIEYNFSQFNHATITNDAYLEANTGDNNVSADRADITTGNAYGAANVVNVVNTNFIDSNYRLLTFNAVGDLDGDLILPTEELFDAFFGLPNGLNQLEHGEEADINVDNQNDATVNNNLNTYAESGQNLATAIDSSITTGRSESESNVLNKVNENVYGGDLMYLWIRIHGFWSGDVIGLPDGLTWEWTSDGVIIYNEDAEITPSELLGHDVDSYTANITNHNDITIDNNINIDAVSGFNDVDGGLVGNIDTGNAFASANVMNIANTNVVGANFTMAIVNVMGNFAGNVTFVQNDLSLSGEVSSPDESLQPESVLNYVYTIANSTDNVATNVVLTQALENAHVVGGSATVQSVGLGNMAPGETKAVNLSAQADADFDFGTTTVVAVASVSSDEGDSNQTDNVVVLKQEVFVVDPSTLPDDTEDEGGGGSGNDSDVTDDETTTSGGGSSGGGSSGGGGGGGSSSNKTKSIDRDHGNDDPDRPPFLIVKKEADELDDGDVIMAGQSVDYTITITNQGGTAYDAVVYDKLINPIGSVLNEQSWDLGTVLADEVISIEYTTGYDLNTPSGLYTNTASIEAYRNINDKEDGEDPLQLKVAVHELTIDGVSLAIGNVGVVAYYANGNGTLNAFITWETNKPASSQALHSLKTYPSVYNPALPNFGYQAASKQLNIPKTKHFMILRNLMPGTEYKYKVRSVRGDSVALGGDYYLTTPARGTTLALVMPDGRVSQVAGAALSVNAPATPVAPARTASPQVPARVTVPTPVPVVPRPVPTPAPVVEPVIPQPEAAPEPVATNPAPVSQASGSSSGFLGGVAKKVFGFFR